MGSPPKHDDALKGAGDRGSDNLSSTASERPELRPLSPSVEGADPDGLSFDLLSTDDLDDQGGSSVLGLEAGQCVGNYRLERVGGQGSFAEVWLALEEREHGFAKRVALKLMKAGARATAGELEAMRAEARLCGMLHHPRLVDVYAAGDIDGLTYIAMEFVEGMTLHELHHQVRAAGLRMPLSVVLDIGIQLCEGLDYAHNAKDHEGAPLRLVHRDLKPGNIMVSRDGQVKIADFGLAKTTTSEQATKEGMLRGTPGFVAPEVWRGTRDFLPSVDLFALGAILFEIATGNPLFEGDIHAIIFRVVSGDVEEDLQQLRLHRPVLAPVLKGLLERKRENRTQQAWEALEPLKALRRKADDPGGLKLFLDLFLPGESDDSESGRLQLLPSTEDSDWHAVLGSVSLLSGSGLVPLAAEAPAVPPTRSMDAPVSVRRPSPTLLETGGGLKQSRKPKPVTPKPRPNSRSWFWVATGFLVLLGLLVVGVMFVRDSDSEKPARVSRESGSSANELSTGAVSERSELIDEGRMGAAQTIEAPPAGAKEPPAVVKEPPAVVKAPPAVVKAPPAVVKEPPAVGKEPPAVVKAPPAVPKEPEPSIQEVSTAGSGSVVQKPAEEASSTPGGAGSPLAVPTGSKGCLVLKSIPGGLLVSLNGKDQGWSAGKRGREEEVEPGWYEVGMGANPGEVEASVKVRVRGGDRVEVRCLWGAKSSCKATKLSGTCGKSS